MYVVMYIYDDTVWKELGLEMSGNIIKNTSDFPTGMIREEKMSHKGTQYENRRTLNVEAQGGTGSIASGMIFKNKALMDW